MNDRNLMAASDQLIGVLVDDAVTPGGTPRVTRHQKANSHALSLHLGKLWPEAEQAIIWRICFNERLVASVRDLLRGFVYDNGHGRRGTPAPEDREEPLSEAEYSDAVRFVDRKSPKEQGISGKAQQHERN